MKIIACTGDSHTWGQGGAFARQTYEGWGEYGVVGGEHRMLPFFTGGYVNLLAELVCARTGSSRTDYGADALAEAFGLARDGNCVRADGLKLPFDGALLRLQFRYTAESAPAAVRVDGKTLWEDDLCREDRKNPYNLITLRLPDGPHTLELSGAAAPLYRIEMYRGPWAVVNCGVGSCPVGRYLTDYYKPYVAALQPAIVLAEAHTINDWLADRNASEFEENLTAYLRQVRADGAQPYLLTVEPVLGTQISPTTGEAQDGFLTASVRAAEREGVPIIDAYTALKEKLDALPDEQARFDAWFKDNWHPNAAGHALYAQCAYSGLFGTQLPRG